MLLYRNRHQDDRFVALLFHQVFFWAGGRSTEVNVKLFIRIGVGCESIYVVLHRNHLWLKRLSQTAKDKTAKDKAYSTGSGAGTLTTFGRSSKGCSGKDTGAASCIDIGHWGSVTC